MPRHILHPRISSGSGVFLVHMFLVSCFKFPTRLVMTSDYYFGPRCVNPFSLSLPPYKIQNDPCQTAGVICYGTAQLTYLQKPYGCGNSTCTKRRGRE